MGAVLAAAGRSPEEPTRLQREAGSFRRSDVMSNVVELQAVRHDQLQKLFDAHRSTLTELICTYAHHMNEPNLATLNRFLDAQDAYVAAFLALDGPL
jgi:hypothetical protein